MLLILYVEGIKTTEIEISTKLSPLSRMQVIFIYFSLCMNCITALLYTVNLGGKENLEKKIFI